MKKSFYLSILLFVVTTGCTGPTQPIAQQAEQTRNKQNGTVVTDLSNIAKQGSLDARTAEAMAAAKAGDASAAKKAVEGLANDWNKINEQVIEYTKARYGLGGIVDQYIWQQQGIASIVIREWEEAKAKVDAKRGATK